MFAEKTVHETIVADSLQTGDEVTQNVWCATLITWVLGVCYLNKVGVEDVLSSKGGC